MNRQLYRKWSQSPVREALRQCAYGRAPDAEQVAAMGLEGRALEQFQAVSAYVLQRSEEMRAAGFARHRGQLHAEADHLSARIVATAEGLDLEDRDDIELRQSSRELADAIVSRRRGW